VWCQQSIGASVASKETRNGTEMRTWFLILVVSSVARKGVQAALTDVLSFVTLEDVHRAQQL